jgi:hypothetical protein
MPNLILVITITKGPLFLLKEILMKTKMLFLLCPLEMRTLLITMFREINRKINLFSQKLAPRIKAPLLKIAPDNNLHKIQKLLLAKDSLTLTLLRIYTLVKLITFNLGPRSNLLLILKTSLSLITLITIKNKTKKLLPIKILLQIKIKIILLATIFELK